MRMKQITRNIYNKYIKRFLPQSMLRKLRASDSICYPIIKNPKDVFESVYHIKDATWEQVDVPDVYRLYRSWSIEQYHPEQDILRIDDCYISNNSDIIVTPQGVVWDKFYSDIFSKTIPMDSDLFQYNRDEVYARKLACVDNILGSSVSLIGVYAHGWSHFIVQFLPKLYYAEKAGLLDKEVTVLIPAYTDLQVIEIVDNVFKMHPLAKKYIVPKDSGRSSIHCERLFYIPTASTLINNGKGPAPMDVVIPQQVVELLIENMIKPIVEKIKNNPVKHEKIYLSRRNWRSLTNSDEVEQYFEKEGFFFVEPHKLTLEEKIDLFYHARVIVGPHSSAWTNILICENVKGLMFTPFGRIIDLYFGYFSAPNKNKIMMITGEDCSYSANTDYYIPLEKIKAAYRQLLEN